MWWTVNKASPKLSVLGFEVEATDIALALPMLDCDCTGLGVALILIDLYLGNGSFG
jgi:hypothetical protein